MANTKKKKKQNLYLVLLIQGFEIFSFHHLWMLVMDAVKLHAAMAQLAGSQLGAF